MCAGERHRKSGLIYWAAARIGSSLARGATVSSAEAVDHRALTVAELTARLARIGRPSAALLRRLRRDPAGGSAGSRPATRAPASSNGPSGGGS